MDGRSRRRRGSALPVVLAVLIVLAALGAGGFFGVRYYYEEGRYTKERADLNEYIGSRGSGDVPVVLNGTLSDVRARMFDGRAYMDIDTVRSLFSRRFYYGEADNEILYCLPDDILSVPVGGSTVTSSAGQADLGYAAARIEDGTLFLALDFVREHADLSYEIFMEPLRMRLDTERREEERVRVLKDTQLRVSGGIKSEIVCDVNAGDTLTVLERMEEWSKVAADDAMYGYILNRRIEDAGTAAVDWPASWTEPEYPTVRLDGKVCLAWFNVAYAGSNELVYDLLAPVKGVNTVGPTWFCVTDEAGTVSDISSADVTAQLHARGYGVWPTLTNFDENGVRQDFLRTRAARGAVISYLTARVRELGADGINVDLENIDDAHGYDFIEFVRELSIACRAQGTILSVDNYVPYQFNDHYDLGEQGIFADYVVLMGYDEHYAGSEEAGSVASIGYVTNGIDGALSRGVPAAKLVNGVPLYTRVWRTDSTTVTSEAVGMQTAREFVWNHGFEVTWDEAACQNYAEGTLQDGTLAQVWLEDAESIGVKLSVMETNGLTGMAAWCLGFETPDVWDVVAGYMGQ